MPGTAIEAAFVAALEMALQPFGFDYDSESEWFSRSHGHFDDIFELCLSACSGSLKITPVALVQVKPVQWFYNRSYQRGTEAARQSGAIGVELKALLDVSNEIEWYIHTERDIPCAVAEVAAVFREHVIPFFQRYSTIEAIDEALNSKPRKECLVSIYPARAAEGLIIAKLLGRPDFDKLAKFYERKVKREWSGVDLPEFQALVKDLRENGRLLQDAWNTPSNT